jgi:hypothetical protein
MPNLPVGVNVASGTVLRLLPSFLAGKVVYPDSPLHSGFGSKLGLALLHESEVAALFSDDETPLIAAHTAWDARGKSERVVWNGHEHVLDLLLRTDKDHFILKKAQSFQGRDVIIVRFSEAATWNVCVANAGGDVNWLVQEYCAPDLVRAFDHELGFCPFEFVWGLFYFADAYSGAFVRGVPASREASDSTPSSVINSVHGAREFAVFEADRKQHILL